MSEEYAVKGSVQFASGAAEIGSDKTQDGVVAELMSENVPLVRYIIW